MATERYTAEELTNGTWELKEQPGSCPACCGRGTLLSRKSVYVLGDGEFGKKTVLLKKVCNTCNGTGRCPP